MTSRSWHAFLALSGLIGCASAPPVAPRTAVPAAVVPAAVLPQQAPPAIAEPEVVEETKPVVTESAPPAKEAAPALPPITIEKGTRVLMFGDSMVTSGLAVSLEERVHALGGKWFHFSKPSSTTVHWADGHDLQDLLARTRPDVVIIALLSNELFVPNPRARIYAVQEIMKRVGKRPCVWVGPPSWRPDKGIVAVARESSAPCRFFDSTTLDLERQSDGIHPTLRGGKAWGEAVWQSAFVAQ